MGVVDWRVDVKRELNLVVKSRMKSMLALGICREWS
jgi:hypothetical protein